jgi:hypothetical protein
MLLNVDVMMGGRYGLMLIIGVFLAGVGTVCFTDRSHGCVGARERHKKNDRN